MFWVSLAAQKPMHCCQWIHCADKFGSGHGTCFTLDADGDQWIHSWEGTNDGGTWAHQSGTGKYAASTSASNGTWKYGRKPADGMGINTWQGNCGD